MNRFLFVFFGFFSITIATQAATTQPRVAIIGGGASGLTTAWLLESDYQVTLFEKEKRLGGHADTVLLENGATVEAGFEFFSKQMFPHFLRLLSILGVQTHEFGLRYTFYKADGSKTVALPPSPFSAIENFSTLMAFNKFLDRGADFIKTKNKEVTVADFVQTVSLDSDFVTEFLYPFLASMWGVSPGEIKNFAALPVVSWLVLNKTSTLSPPRWFEVEKGTQAYIEALRLQLKKTEIKLDSEVVEVLWQGNQYKVKTRSGTEAYFDDVVFATNAFTAKNLLASIDHAKDIREQLSKIRYFKTYIAIHGDSSVMPQDHSSWGEVNVAYNGTSSAITVFKQWRSSGSPVFKSWVTHEIQNCLKLPEPLLAPVHEYFHAVVDLNYLSAQDGLKKLQGQNGLWLAGVYTGAIDSHESAIVSAIEIARKLAPQSERLRLIAPINR